MNRFVGLAWVALLSSAALAVQTGHWVHTKESDFKEGDFKNVVATNLGDLKLSREVKTLLGQDARVSAVYSLAQSSDGTVYAATGPEGLVLTLKDGKIETAADIGQYTNCYSVIVDSKGRVLVGTGGEKGHVYAIEKVGEKPKSIFEDEDVQYVWALTQTPDGMVYAATGPNGKLFEIDPAGKSRLVFDSEENNLLSLVSDGKDFLYVGTDPNGLVCRVNRKTGELFVVYDAPEAEISALARDAKGNLYAGTADALGEGSADESTETMGRPESESSGNPLPSTPPKAPKPPELPDPNPGEPLPIPKSTKAMSILAAPDEAPSADAKPTSEPAAEEKPEHVTSGKPSPERTPNASGNAIYRIDADGFVSEVFRQSSSVFAMVPHDGSLLVATGAEGELYQISPDAGEMVVLAKLDSKDAMSLLPLKDGQLVVGLANAGELATLSAAVAKEGTFTSQVLDAAQVAKFGKMALRGTLPKGTSITVATRSGNVEEASSPGWSDWSREIPALAYLQVASPSARFFQYRLTFKADGESGTPLIEDVDVAYQVSNLAPKVSSIKIESPDAADTDSAVGGAEEDVKPPSSVLKIEWEATDPNEDRLVYSLYFRKSEKSPWILLKDKLKDPTYEWQTHAAGDGHYTVKVEASDAAANPVGAGKTASRVSDPFVIDNTAPVIGDIATEPKNDGVGIKLSVVDRTTTVSRLEYSVDSSMDWQSVLPSDTIADSPDETYDFRVEALSPGPHQITVRATDAKGNRSSESVTVTIDKKK